MPGCALELFQFFDCGGFSGGIVVNFCIDSLVIYFENDEAGGVAVKFIGVNFQ